MKELLGIPMETSAQIAIVPLISHGSTGTAVPSIPSSTTPSWL